MQYDIIDYLTIVYLGTVYVSGRWWIDMEHTSENVQISRSTGGSTVIPDM